MRQISTSLLVLFLTFSHFSIVAQNTSAFQIPFKVYGEDLAFPLTGGANAPQLSEADLNNDGILDLYIFDRIGAVHLTYINDGTPNASSYTYAPEYAANFPDSLKNFVLLRDYNDDGIHDIFAYSLRPGIHGVAVLQGYYDNDNRLAFNLVHDLLFYPGTSNNLPVNLLVLSSDVPAVDDIDCDGDLDIVTFDLGGGTADYYRNYSGELGYGKDSLIYQLEEDCWGGFYESGFSSDIELAENEGECAINLQGEPDSLQALQLHASSTLLTFDIDNDNDKDLFLGDGSFEHITFLRNGGSCSDAYMDFQETNFPSYDSPVDIPVFPAAFHLDLNNDGLKDFIAAPNNPNSTEDKAVIWYYKNTTDNDNPVFQLQEKDWLVRKSLDLGTGTNPAFVDYNADGLMDLVVGTFGAQLPFGVLDPRLYLFENKGTAQAPAFELIDDDWLDFSQYYNSSNAPQIRNFSPTFGDLDSDGDQDMLVGTEQGGLFYVENLAGAGNPITFATPIASYKNIDPQSNSRPAIADLNEDGLNDIIVGVRNGRMVYFQNEGSIGAPEFYGKVDTLNNIITLGDVVIGNQIGDAAPLFVKTATDLLLFAGSDQGDLSVYNNIEGNHDGTFTELYADYGNFNIGINTTPAVADIDNDGLLEIIVGNTRGGLNAYKTDIEGLPVSTKEIQNEALAFDIFPNPASDKVHIQLKAQKGKLELYNQLGELMLQVAFQDTITLDTTPFEAGVYFVKLNTEEGSYTRKLLVQQY